ncbi:MAG: NAD-dependent epimerase/dehydratase family protein [Candidatus Coatesbacteria bacterium]|nr:MAG: NAD-dependent epimerase/dehydratase family protein [Candidatus Coatesbacteria bacterium]
MARYVVTGGAGFIGSHLVERLLAEGNDVVALDNLLTGDAENVALLAQYDGLKFEEVDVSQPYGVAETDYVLHVASPASPVDFERLPFEIMAVNSEGTRLAAEAALARGARFLFASTSEVYGDPEVHPQGEDYWGHVNPAGPRAVYDESKRFGEALVAAYRRYRGLDARVVRIFNTYGPRMRPADGRLIPNLISQALAGEPLTVYGDGTQTRSFCYVDDMVDGILALLHSDVTEPVNVGNPEEMTVLAMAELVREAVDGSLEIVFQPLPVDDPRRRRPDITRATELLGWAPRVPVAEGLAKTIAWFREKAGA